MLTYHDLMAFWECPRLLVYRSLGFEPLERPAPMLQGTLVHRGIAAWWRGSTAAQGIADAAAAYLLRFGEGKRTEIKAALSPLVSDALELCAAYSSQLTQPFRPIQIEQPITVEGIAGTPDAIGYVKDQDGSETLAIIELKTGEQPHVPALVHQRQADFYAFLYMVANHEILKAEAVCLDIISPKYCYRHQYSPNYERGFHLWASIEKLSHYDLWQLATEPHYSFRCAACDFFHPCQVKEAGGKDLEILEAEYFYDPARDKRKGEL